VSRASKSLFQESSSSSSRRDAMLRCAHGEEQQCPISFQRSDDEEEAGLNEEEGELECVLRQTQRSHMVAPPIVPTREEDRVLIRPLGDR
jgi:hypothetical protein